MGLEPAVGPGLNWTASSKVSSQTGNRNAASACANPSRRARFARSLSTGSRMLARPTFRGQPRNPKGPAPASDRGTERQDSKNYKSFVTLSVRLSGGILARPSSGPREPASR